MDRYVDRKPRHGARPDYPQGNQMPMYPPSGLNDIASHINASFGSYNSNLPQQAVPRCGPSTSSYPTNIYPDQGQVMSGIDPRYLAAFADTNAMFIASAGNQVQREASVPPSAFGNDYLNRNFTGPNRNESNLYTPQRFSNVKTPQIPETSQQPSVKVKTAIILQQEQQRRNDNTKIIVRSDNMSTKKTTELDLLKSEVQDQAKTRSEKLKDLYSTGTRIFSGPVEKILKWNKPMQEIGAMVLYEIVGKCVSIRPGESCAKNLVVRDENGPAIQVVYYEIDFLLPELKVPCTVRVIGRMMAGTCRLQAFSVRVASGDDVAALPRRAAVAVHHVTKLCKLYLNH